MSLLHESGHTCELDGLTALFHTRAEADLAVEHLAQEHGIDPAFIYVEAAAEENTAGIAASGGDQACAAPSHQPRPDAPLRGVIRLTVPVERGRMSVLKAALEEAGGQEVELF